MKENKILVIVGSTASGKSDLAVELALKFNGEIISADSRQVFKGLDIGSGKITQAERRGVPHHLLDVVYPRTIFTVTKFQKLARKKITEILAKGKLPIVCGGTGLYIKAIIDNVDFPKVKPDLKLRADLEKKSTDELLKILQKLDSAKASEIDSKNPRRLIRAIEISTSLGLGNLVTKFPLGNLITKWEMLQIGIKIDREVLKEKIANRFLKRVKQGIIQEAKKLHQTGLTYKRFSEIGLAHKYLALYLQGKISKEEFIRESIKAEQKYAKRQMTWFQRDQRIHWFALTDKQKTINLVHNFLLGGSISK